MAALAPMANPVDGAARGRDDPSALAWVHVELRRSLETAHKALRRHLRESDTVSGSDVDAVDPSVLRSARAQLHQGVGALELVGLPALADVLRASEAAVQRMAARPAMIDHTAIETIEQVSFALLDCMARMIAGKPVSPVQLFPQYRAARMLAGADRIHPADLWKIDWQWLELPADPAAQPRRADDAARGDMETLVLALMRDPGRGPLARMSDLCADLAAGARGGDTPDSARLATFWQLAAAVFEAQATGLLAGDVHTKRIASRLLAQLRMSVRGHHELSDRLAQDLLFFCSHAGSPRGGTAAPRLAAVRRAWRLDEHPTAAYEAATLGRFDPAVLAQARKRVAAAKEGWSAAAGGELHRLGSLGEQFALVGESLQRLLPDGEVLAHSLAATAAQTMAAGEAPPPALAMEVATGVLYVEATLEDAELDHPELGARVRELAQRIDGVRIGADPQPLELWMEELYRRVSDRQTMGSVVQELRASLSEVEKQIDQYFRNPAQRELLFPVPAQLSAMRGVLSVLGLGHASQAVVHMRDAVDELAQTEVDPQRAAQTGSFDRLADNLGALSFLIDMLAVQPALAKSLFRFDTASGSLSAVMGQTGRVSAFADLDLAPTSPPPPAPATRSLIEQLEAMAADAASPEVADVDLAATLERLAQQALAADQPELSRLLAQAQRELRQADDAAARLAVRDELVQAMAARAPVAPEPAPAAPAIGPPDQDAELREIFIDEAREVVGDARAALERLADEPGDALGMTTVRRAFHTLKGSARMVGLPGFGDAAWACEQVYNARLAQSPRMDPTLRQFSVEALDYLAGWVEAIAAGRGDGHAAGAVARAADALRLHGQRLPIAPAHAPGEVAAAAPAAEHAHGVPMTQPALAEKAETAETAAMAEAAEFAAPAEMAATADTPAPVEAGETVEPIDQVFDGVLQPEPVDAEATVEMAAAEAAFEAEFGDDAEPLPAWAETMSFEPPPAPEVPADAEATLPSFEFDLREGDEEATPPVAAAGSSLVARVPGLPSAADLDLGPAGGPAALPFAAEVAPAPVEPGAESPPPVELPAPEVETLAMDTRLEELLFPDAAEPPPHAAAPALPEFRLDLGDAVAGPMPAGLPPADGDEEEPVKVVGHLRIGIPLFNIFLNEADELSRRLGVELAEWSHEHDRHPVPASAVALAHSLAGSSATVGYAELSMLARALEHALMQSHAAGRSRPGEPELFNEVADEIRRLLHQFAAGFLRPVAPVLLERLALAERQPVEPPPTAVSAWDAGPAAPESDLPAEREPSIDVVDAVAPELFAIFEEEADELLPQLQARLREWVSEPAALSAAAACLRTLHTFKGGARLAGAMRLGEMAHRLETAIERLAGGDASAAAIEPLLAAADAMASTFEALRHERPATAPPSPSEAPAPAAETEAPTPAPAAETHEPAAAEVAAEAVPVDALPAVQADATEAPAPAALPSIPEVDWQRLAAAEREAEVPAAAGTERAAAGPAVVRVRAALLDRLVNQAGEVSITRARLDADVRQMQAWLAELTESLDRMRRQLRDIEVQAETQISSRIEAAKAAALSFDPLEMDRFTRFQELTRFMAESVNDVATLQRSLQRTLQSTEDELAAQARLTRELQDDLLRTRMVEFESIADRLHRTVRQAARDTGRQAQLQIEGGAIEVDRGVLERMTGAFEHLLRNAVVHGIEPPPQREGAGKPALGRITVAVAQSGNEVAVEFTDDGGGLDLRRVHRRAVERGLLPAGVRVPDAELAQMIFQPGFSTADSVTELAGRGVGLDVVRAEVVAMGGRIETTTRAGQGTSFRLLLPLTTAVTQVVMLRCASLQVAVPSTLVEVVRRVDPAEVERAYAEGVLAHGGEELPFFWLAGLLRAGARGAADAAAVVVVRSAAQRVAVHVDEVIGNQEVVVKNVGPQLARLPGLTGVTLLPTGAVALIYNPVALASVYADAAREQLRYGAAAADEAPPAAPRAPLVMVVDDSLTVRRVTQRLLQREGYRVVLAKDGMEALERLADERPVVLLSDIEMPRMDGFDLVRNLRADARLAALPVVMITSRIAQKHRDYAAELGVQHYLGKPYAEDELLALVARYADAAVPDPTH